MALYPIALLAVLAATLNLGGCAESMSLTQLPQIGNLSQKVLSKDEQQIKVNEMIEKAQTHQSAAEKRIENAPAVPPPEQPRAVKAD